MLHYFWCPTAQLTNINNAELLSEEILPNREKGAFLKNTLEENWNKSSI